MKVERGQVWKSRMSYPKVGYYTIQIVSVDEKSGMASIKFTASGWKDGHQDFGEQTIQSILDNYVRIK